MAHVFAFYVNYNVINRAKCTIARCPFVCPLEFPRLTPSTVRRPRNAQNTSSPQSVTLALETRGRDGRQQERDDNHNRREERSNGNGASSTSRAFRLDDEISAAHHSSSTPYYASKKYSEIHHKPYLRPLVSFFALSMGFFFFPSVARLLAPLVPVSRLNHVDTLITGLSDF